MQIQSYMHKGSKQAHKFYELSRKLSKHSLGISITIDILQNIGKNYDEWIVLLPSNREQRKKHINAKIKNKKVEFIST